MVGGPLRKTPTHAQASTREPSVQWGPDRYAVKNRPQDPGAVSLDSELRGSDPKCLDVSKRGWSLSWALRQGTGGGQAIPQRGRWEHSSGWEGVSVVERQRGDLEKSGEGRGRMLGGEPEGQAGRWFCGWRSVPATVGVVAQARSQ